MYEYMLDTEFSLDGTINEEELERIASNNGLEDCDSGTWLMSNPPRRDIQWYSPDRDVLETAASQMRAFYPNLRVDVSGPYNDEDPDEG